MKTALSSALIATLLLCGCSAKGRIQNHIPANAGVYEDAEGYAVLSMLLNGSSTDARRISMVTHVESVKGTHSLEDCMKVPEEFRDAANDYERRANTALVLKRKLTLRTSYDLVGETRITGSGVRSAPTTGNDVSVKTSGGTFYLSPVGFDANRTHAIAYLNYLCGNRCGWGGFHLLVKNGGRWEEAKDVGGCAWNY